MAAKGGSSGGNKNTVMGAVLGVLVLAIAGIWWMNSGEDEEPVQETPVVETAAPEPEPAKPAGRAPDREAQRERSPDEPAPTRQEEGEERAPTRGRNQPAPEKLNTAPPA
ncbi:MAG: hypothetical protein FLDDKLPJ_02487 [Phycisphaerae bacterium]|nr:hypothetical protein [Phycisphaerae bacterium]